MHVCIVRLEELNVCIQEFSVYIFLYAVICCISKSIGMFESANVFDINLILHSSIRKFPKSVKTSCDGQTLVSFIRSW